MGCDIYVVIQVQEPGGAWVEIPWQIPWQEATKAPRSGVAVAPAVFDEWNYVLFGVLAGVRDEVVTPIAEARGWPPGFDPAGVASDRDDGDERPRFLGDHSFSWVTLAELESYLWDVRGQGQWLGVMTKVLPWLRGLATGRPLRLVFGFDS